MYMFDTVTEIFQDGYMQHKNSKKSAEKTPAPEQREEIEAELAEKLTFHMF